MRGRAARKCDSRCASFCCDGTEAVLHDAAAAGWDASRTQRARVAATRHRTMPFVTTPPEIRRTTALLWTALGALAFAACASGSTDSGADLILTQNVDAGTPGGALGGDGASSEEDAGGAAATTGSTGEDAGGQTATGSGSGSVSGGSSSGGSGLGSSGGGAGGSSSGGSSSGSGGSGSGSTGSSSGASGSSSGAGGGVVPTTCNEAYGAVGCCAGSTAYYCSSSSNSLSSKTCSGSDVCGWDAAKSYYYCVAAPGGADPSGANPIACQ